MPTRIIMHSVCHVFYYVNGNWIGSFFSSLLCLYGNQEIRLTDVPAILMAASSHQSFLAILFLCRTSLSLSLSPSLTTPSLSSPSLLLRLMCSLLGKEGNFHIESQPGSGDLDLTPSLCCTPNPTPTNENVFVCVWVCVCVHCADVSGPAAWWKCNEIAVCCSCSCCCWQKRQAAEPRGNNRNVILFFLSF